MKNLSHPLFSQLTKEQTITLRGGAQWVEAHGRSELHYKTGSAGSIQSEDDTLMRDLLGENGTINVGGLGDEVFLDIEFNQDPTPTTTTNP